MYGEQPRSGDGKFAEWKGTHPEVSLNDQASVQSALDADSTLPPRFRYVAAGSPGALTVFMFAPHDMEQNEYLDVQRSRLGKKAYQPEVRRAMTRIMEMPGVKWMSVVPDEPPAEVKLTQQGYPYTRNGRHVVDVKLTGPAGSFTAPVPSGRSQEAVEWLAQTGQFPVLEKVVGPEEAERLIRAQARDSVPEFTTDDTLF
jgi:hypothetical protein